MKPFSETVLINQIEAKLAALPNDAARIRVLKYLMDKYGVVWTVQEIIPLNSPVKRNVEVLGGGP